MSWHEEELKRKELQFEHSEIGNDHEKEETLKEMKQLGSDNETCDEDDD